MSNQSNQVGKVVVAQVQDEKGEVQSVDPDDHILLVVNSPSSNNRAEELADDSIWCLRWSQGHILSADFAVPGGRSLQLTGRFDEAPTEAIFDFSFSVTSSGVVATHPRNDVIVFWSAGLARLFVGEVAASDRRVCVRATYAGACSLIVNT